MTKVTQSNLQTVVMCQHQVITLEKMINAYVEQCKTVLGVSDDDGFILDFLVGATTFDALCKALDLKLELNESQPLLEAA